MPLKDPEKKREYDKLWRERNKERILAERRQYYQDNKERQIETSREWYKNNKDRKIEVQSKYHKREDEKIKIEARRILKKYMDNNNILKRNSCEICHSSPTQCHHDSYSEPLEYIELCMRCHKMLHLQYREKGLTTI